jgi:hypothetical protein
MKAARQPRGPPPLSLPLAEPLRSLSARLDGAGRITCGKLTLSGPHPIVALCRRLRRAGVPDVALRVSHPDRSPAALVLSIHATAGWSNAALSGGKRQ